MPDKSPKTIATINFKGGVGKTTVTWCLGDVLSSTSNMRGLMFDLDAQMSLTQAIALNEATGFLQERFGKWYETARQRKKTIFDALDAFTKPMPHFDFPVGFDFIYQITKNFHFIPSVEDLYWQELEVFDRDGVRGFIGRLLGKISNNRQIPPYDFVLFDCPPSFTLLSYSVLSCCDLVLIPVNPDFFASRGVALILNSLRLRIEPHPLPKIGIFMNKAKTWGNSPTKEVQFYMREVQKVCDEAAKSQAIDARFFKSYIRERVGIKRAITGGGVPPEMISDFQDLWRECVEFLG
ncbi:MAG: cobyrinic acid a,c-diamide synthase [Omnitrophica WOR_2 bacterium RIFCSPHIGHO2_02_FULL_50_17]|nr:MAG: cobyrinic acid a,c-diamide synthase [Omnitrophica WOR_2 bacterium RIFCSPHIGHO2_02_FULL_50_17]